MSDRLKVALTGISGRFGGLVANLLHRTHQVVGIDRRPCRHLPKDRLSLHRRSS